MPNDCSIICEFDDAGVVLGSSTNVCEEKEGLCYFCCKINTVGKVIFTVLRLRSVIFSRNLEKITVEAHFLWEKITTHGETYDDTSPVLWHDCHKMTQRQTL